MVSVPSAGGERVMNWSRNEWGQGKVGGTEKVQDSRGMLCTLLQGILGGFPITYKADLYLGDSPPPPISPSDSSFPTDNVE